MNISPIAGKHKCALYIIMFKNVLIVNWILGIQNQIFEEFIYHKQSTLYLKHNMRSFTFE